MLVLRSLLARTRPTTPAKLSISSQSRRTECGHVKRECDIIAIVTEQHLRGTCVNGDDFSAQRNHPDPSCVQQHQRS